MKTISLALTIVIFLYGCSTNPPSNTLRVTRQIGEVVAGDNLGFDFEIDSRDLYHAEQIEISSVKAACSCTEADVEFDSFSKHFAVSGNWKTVVGDVLITKREVTGHSVDLKCELLVDGEPRNLILSLTANVVSPIGITASEPRTTKEGYFRQDFQVERKSIERERFKLLTFSCDGPFEILEHDRTQDSIAITIASNGSVHTESNFLNMATGNLRFSYPFSVPLSSFSVWPGLVRGQREDDIISYELYYALPANKKEISVEPLHESDKNLLKRIDIGTEQIAIQIENGPSDLASERRIPIKLSAGEEVRIVNLRR